MGRRSLLRTIFRFAVTGVLFFGCISSHASAEKLTAAEWKGITTQRKLYFIFALRERFQEEGTVFGRSAEAYLKLLDQKAAVASPGDDMDAFFGSLAAVEPASDGAL